MQFMAVMWDDEGYTATGVTDVLSAYHYRRVVVGQTVLMDD